MKTAIRNPVRLPLGLLARGGLGCACLLAAIAGLSACASAPPPPELTEAQRAARIEELRESIARDHAILQDWVSRPRTDDDPALHQNPTVRAISRRLGDQERELERLIDLETTPAPPTAAP